VSIQDSYGSLSVDFLSKIDSYIRDKNPLVKQVNLYMSSLEQNVLIIRKDGSLCEDHRPMFSLRVSIVLEKNGRKEIGLHGCGGRESQDVYTDRWKQVADEAFRQAEINLESIAAPAGEMTVVLGSGFPGILLHEAIGHGLEGDFNRKGTSVYSGSIGKRIASKGVTVVDDGTISGRRGSIKYDDEGNKSSRNVLIEDGILVKYMQDSMNASLMGVPVTGNGRRQSYRHTVMPRMTNTYMLSGEYAPDEIVGSVENGVYAVNFSGGQVDITSGQFVFSASESYMIKDGRITHPLKGATLIGKGSDVLQKISMIGNDSILDSGMGTCSKDGQDVPVGVGQPTLKIDSITVGGSSEL